MTHVNGLRSCAVAAVVLIAASQAAHGAGQDPVSSGWTSGVITLASEDWVEIKEANGKTRRFLLPTPTIAEQAQPAISRLEAMFHVQAGKVVDVVWQMTDGQPTVVGVIAKSSGLPAAAGGFVAAGPGQSPMPFPKPQPVRVCACLKGDDNCVAPSWPNGTQSNPDPFDGEYGTFMGFVTGKGGADWIDVCPVYYQNTQPTRFAPMQVRPAVGGDNGLDLRMQEAIRRLPVGARVQVYWIYANGKRAVRIVPSTQNGELAIE